MFLQKRTPRTANRHPEHINIAPAIAKTYIAKTKEVKVNAVPIPMQRIVKKQIKMSFLKMNTSLSIFYM